jgi:hypothetical protein
MKRNPSKIVAAFCLAAGLAYAGISSGGGNVVTNPPPAVNAKMTLDPTTCTWSVEGSANPSYKGFGSSVSLVCLDARCSTSGGQCETRTVGSTNSSCDFDNDQVSCPPGVDPCTGQFSFMFSGLDAGGNCVAADPSQLCFFVAHVNVTNKQMCNGKPAGDAPDPNGSAPCSGGYCPSNAR